jgi:hypothetical protein
MSDILIDYIHASRECRRLYKELVDVQARYARAKKRSGEIAGKVARLGLPKYNIISLNGSKYCVQVDGRTIQVSADVREHKTCKNS